MTSSPFLRRLCAAAATCTVSMGVLAGCGSSSSGSGGPLLVALDVPATGDVALSRSMTRGADLGVKEVNAAGGVSFSGTQYTLQLRTYDDGLDPTRAAANTDGAIRDGAVAIIEDGTGATISAPRTRAAGIPEIITADGTAALGDGSLPSVFRLGINNGSAASVLSTYIGTKKASTVAIIHDDSPSGRDGDTQMRTDLPTAQVHVGPDLEVPATLPTLDAQLATVAAANPDGLVVWGGDTFIGRVVSSLHSAGMTLPVYAGPAAESPTVRQIAGLQGSDGVRFVASRMPSENDAVSFGQFEHRLANAEGGPIDAGVRNAAGQEIRQPADTDMFTYDAVKLIAAALAKTGPPGGGHHVLDAFTRISILSANGDRRGFTTDIHEGIADGDLYIAQIHDNQFQPVKDEPLSASLPHIDEVLSEFR